MAFNFFKKDNGVPDVGQEEVYEEKKEKESSILEKSKNILKKGKKKDNKEKKEPKEETSSADKPIGELYGVEDSPAPVSKPAPVKSPISDETNKLEFSKINAKLESVNTLIKGFNERFSNMSQQIGEVRSMNLSNEKNISKAVLEGSKAVDIVKEVRPEKLRIDYQRADLKMQTLTEKIEANRQFAETVMNEIKDLRRKAGIFVGTDALLKLNEDVKMDLIELQKVGARVRLNADKSEQLFVELKKGFTENQKFNEVFANLDTSYSGLQKEVEKLKLDYSKVLNEGEFSTFKKTTENKIALVESNLPKIDKVHEENERLGGLIETILAVAKKNERDIADIGITIGDDSIKKVADYENQLTTVLRVVGNIAKDVGMLKKKAGMKSEGSVLKNVEKIKKDVEKIKDKKPVVREIIKEVPVVKKEVSEVKKEVPEVKETLAVKKVPEVKPVEEKLEVPKINTAEEVPETTINQSQVNKLWEKWIKRTEDLVENKEIKEKLEPEVEIKKPVKKPIVKEVKMQRVKKGVDKRLNNLKKARKVRARNLKGKERIAKERLKNLEKARAVRMKHLKSKKSSNSKK